jgi:site-specific DNA recombinase
MSRAVIYIRVSTKEQTHNLSLPTQEAACREHCVRLGLEVDRVFSEMGESAKTTERTEFQRALEYCGKNRKSIKAFVVYKVDRFARCTEDYLTTRGMLLKLGVSVISVTEPFDNSPFGRAMETMLATFAELDNNIRAERTRDGMRTALARGKWTFQAPIGYRNDGGFLRIDPVQGPLVAQAFEMYATGSHTKSRILDRLNRRGFRSNRNRPLSPQTFDNLLRNPFYAGRIVAMGVEARGDFQALVSQDVFERVQNVLRGKATQPMSRRKTAPDFPLRGFIRCSHCGRPLTASWSKSRSGARYAYYRCPSSRCHNSIPRIRLEDKFAGLLAQLQPNREMAQLFTEILRDIWKSQQSERLAAARTIEARLENLKSRQRRLLEAFVHERAIDRQTYEEEKRRSDDEMGQLQDDLDGVAVEAFDVEGLLRFAEWITMNAASIWREGGIDQQQRLQAVFFPAGLSFGADGFGTGPTCLYFRELGAGDYEKASLASPAGVEPAS